jgi:hypothetical protein
MLDLLPKRPVSRQPAIRRDLPIAVKTVEDDQAATLALMPAIAGKVSIVVRGCQASDARYRTDPSNPRSHSQHSAKS